MNKTEWRKMNTVIDIRNKVQEMLTQERAKQIESMVEESLSEHDRGLTDGWVEALECVLVMIEETIPTIKEWARIQNEAIIGLSRVAIAHIEENNAEKAVETLTRTINQLSGVRGEEE
tara:strand:+ start:288 stop:641 length:354 start_codon:yes stop_codon:yes gene_type:complete